MNFASAPSPGPVGMRSTTPKRPTWHWVVLGAAGLVALLVALIVVAIIAWQILGRGNPENTLDDFYTSLQDSDCELFEESTTQEYRDITGINTCDVFDEVSSGVTGIDYEVTDRVNRQGYAIFYVTERYTDGDERVDVPLRYYVERIGGQWDLAGIEVVDPSAPDPITGS